MNTMTKLTAAVICALALTACGGGGSDDGDSTSAWAVEGGDPGDSGVQASYAVTASVSGVGGAVKPSGVVAVLPGATTSFTLTPNTGYVASSVIGTCGGTLGSNNVYTTKAITKDCTVVATFAAAGP